MLVYDITLRCLTNLLLITALPPPGSPMVARMNISMIYLNSKSDISYHPLWSCHCLNNSKTGCAPYISFLGMFKSSIRHTPFLFPSGPNTPIFLRFILLPNELWIVMTPVRAENVKLNTVYLFAGNILTNWSQFKDLPVPVAPHLST